MSDIDTKGAGQGNQDDGNQDDPTKTKDLNDDLKGNSNSGDQGDPDPSGDADTLTKEQWEQAYKSPRFAKLLESDKKLKELERQREEEEEARLKEEGKTQELLEKEKSKSEALSKENEILRKEQAISLAGIKAGVSDVDALVKLSDIDSVEFADDGSSNAEALVTSLLEEKPYLVGNRPSSNIGGSQNKSKDSQDNKPVYDQDELRMKMRDHAWYKENKEEVEAALREGRVVRKSQQQM